MFLTIVYFLVTLLILVVVHEYGHFIVARCVGVKVLRFSVGFGKVLASFKDKRGTEYALSIIPLGGYVKMLDEHEAPVPENERHLAFNNKSLLARTAVVVAGPLFNLIFAFFAFWLVLVIGSYSLAPMIQSVKPGSIAAKAGIDAKEEIVSLDNKSIASWQDFQYAMMPYIGSTDTIPLILKSWKTGKTRQVDFSLSQWEIDPRKPDLLDSLGIVPFIPAIPPVVDEVMSDSPAKEAGIEPLDLIVKINNKPIEDWIELVNWVRNHPGEGLSLSIIRNAQHIQVPVTIGSVAHDGKHEGYLGLKPKEVAWPEKWLRYQHLNAFLAIGGAFSQTMDVTRATFMLMGRFVTGKLSLDNISGPVGIAQSAGDSARNGLIAFLSFLALVSISLGCLNLLPIPMLDGGHLLYYLIEAIRRRELSETVKTLGFYFGFVLLVTLVLFALNNDISRLS